MELVNIIDFAKGLRPYGSHLWQSFLYSKCYLLNLHKKFSETQNCYLSLANC
ncbi:hypothetical protein HMPREF9073_01483 [Capnocytophaga sp. oral taxon 326 str. F0382]|nr:hypothetical protein HMPREF9073_01483 [Capnocytophaga sp. oral taxon 326 str. F0382]